MIATVFLVALASLQRDPRTERLVALARLDAAVRYFDPAVATRASSWDSLFASSAVRIADAPTTAEYRRLIGSTMQALHPDAPRGGPQRALVYEGFPAAMMRSSGGYGLRWRAAGAGETYRVDMGEGVSVDVAVSEGSDDTTEPVSPLAPPSTVEWRAAYPARGYRILAAARIWSTIRLFYPYKSLIGENWDNQLHAALPEFERARDSLEYGLAVARFTAHIHDAHVTVGSNAVRAYFGTAPIGAAVRFIENELVVTRIVDSSATRAGLRVGDIVVSIDGEPTAQRAARLTPFISASTPQSLHFRLESTLLNGATESKPAHLVVRGPDGADRSLSVPRSRAFAQRLQKHRTGNIIRILPGNIGYIDLDRLPNTMVDSAFRILAGTRALILDDRGYPLGTAWSIAPRINVHSGSTVAAKFRRLVVSSPDTARTTLFEFDQPIPPSQGLPKYTGRTVLLVDERTISQAEHTGLFFEAANGTTIIGSPTMGANGDVTMFAIPGNINITFTGHDVRHADGRQLQRVGLQPQVAVTPTVAGIRAGRDEVLEAASKYVGGTGEIPPDRMEETPVAPLAALPPEPAVDGWKPAGSATEAYRIGLDRTVAHGGSSSGHVTARTATPDGYATLMQVIRSNDYRGKRVRFSAFVKTRGMSGSTGLWMRVDGNGGILAFDNMLNRSISGTTDWTRVSVVLDVPNEADDIALGLLVNGGGEAWIDDAALEIVSAEVPSTNMQPASPDPSNAEQMRRRYASAPTAMVNPGFEAP